MRLETLNIKKTKKNLKKFKNLRNFKLYKTMLKFVMLTFENHFMAPDQLCSNILSNPAGGSLASGDRNTQKTSNTFKKL